MEKNIDDFLSEIAEAKEVFDATPGFSLSKEDAEKIAERLAQVVNFENKISSVKGLRSIINDVKRYKEKSPTELVDKNGNEENDQFDFEISSALQKTIKEIDKLCNKDPKDLTKDELKKMSVFASKLSDEFKKFVSGLDTEYKETGVNTWKIKFQQSFPVKLTITFGGDKENTPNTTSKLSDYMPSDEEESKTKVGSEKVLKYYGLVRPPTGVITWQGPTARAKARSLGIPIKMPLINVGSKDKPDFKVKRGAAAFGEFMKFQGTDDEIDFNYDDSTEAKEKVIQALEKAGVSFKTDNFEKRGALKGVEDAVNNIKLDDMIEESLNEEEKDLSLNEGLTKNVGFWQDITQIF